MNKRVDAIVITVLMLLSLVVIIVHIAPRVTAPTTLYVDDDNTGFEDGSQANPYNTIQEGIDNASSGDTVFVYNGTYYENVVVNKTISLIGEDKDNTTVDGNGTGYAMVASSDWVNITGFTFTNGSLFSPLLWTSGADHCRIWDNIVRDSEDIGISIEVSSDIKVLNNTLFGNSHYGIRVGASDNVFIIGNDIYDNNNNCIKTSSSSFVTIHNNTVQSNSARGIVIDSNSDNCIVENNTIDNLMTGLHGVGIIGASNSTFKNNSMDKWGFYFSGSFIHNWNTHTIDNSNTVGGKPICYQKNQIGGSVPGDPGQIILGNCTEITISGQTINNSHPAIYLGFSNHNNVTDCVLDGGGIGLYRSHNNTFELDTINDTGRAFFLSYSDGNIITDCVISNSNEGAYLHSSCNNTLSNNTVDLHTQHGFKLSYYSNENTIYENTISNNPYGVRIYSDSHNNTIYWNNFINNGIQAWDQGNNIWNLSYPSGGNYWSNYGGVDNYKGPKQNIPGRDGIGDTNYSIDSDSIDNYPLMAPYKPLENYTILKQGWNLISIPLIQEERNLTRVLGSIDGLYDSVWLYNVTDSIHSVINFCVC